MARYTRTRRTGSLGSYVVFFLMLVALFAYWGQKYDGSPQSLPACVMEDGSTQQTCFWDAQKQGNGQGRSFISYNYGERVEYVK